MQKLRSCLWRIQGARDSQPWVWEKLCKLQRLKGILLFKCQPFSFIHLHFSQSSSNSHKLMMKLHISINEQQIRLTHNIIYQVTNWNCVQICLSVCFVVVVVAIFSYCNYRSSYRPVEKDFGCNWTWSITDSNCNMYAHTFLYILYVWIYFILILTQNFQFQSKVIRVFFAHMTELRLIQKHFVHYFTLHLDPV